MSSTCSNPPRDLARLAALAGVTMPVSGQAQADTTSQPAHATEPDVQTSAGESLRTTFRDGLLSGTITDAVRDAADQLGQAGVVDVLIRIDAHRHWHAFELAYRSGLLERSFDTIKMLAASESDTAPSAITLSGRAWRGLPDLTVDGDATELTTELLDVGAVAVAVSLCWKASWFPRGVIDDDVALRLSALTQIEDAYFDGTTGERVSVSALRAIAERNLQAAAALINVSDATIEDLASLLESVDTTRPGATELALRFMQALHGRDQDADTATPVPVAALPNLRALATKDSEIRPLLLGLLMSQTTLADDELVEALQLNARHQGWRLAEWLRGSYPLNPATPEAVGAFADAVHEAQLPYNAPHDYGVLYELNPLIARVLAVVPGAPGELRDYLNHNPTFVREKEATALTAAASVAFGDDERLWDAFRSGSLVFCDPRATFRSAAQELRDRWTGDAAGEAEQAATC